LNHIIAFILSWREYSEANSGERDFWNVSPRVRDNTSFACVGGLVPNAKRFGQVGPAHADGGVCGAHASAGTLGARHGKEKRGVWCARALSVGVVAWWGRARTGTTREQQPTDANATPTNHCYEPAPATETWAQAPWTRLSVVPCEGSSGTR
jgi:hypothetical protein